MAMVRRHSIATTSFRLPPPPMHADSPIPTRLPRAMRRVQCPLPTPAPHDAGARKMVRELRRHSFFLAPPATSTATTTTTMPSPIQVLSTDRAVEAKIQRAFPVAVKHTAPVPVTPTQELPILRHRYLARDVRVAVGPSWKLQRFEVKCVRLQTGAMPTLIVFSKPATHNSAATFTLPTDTSCTIKNGNQLKLKSREDSRLRLRIRFATAADASVWSRLVQDALEHAKWIKEQEEVACLAQSKQSRVMVVRHVKTKEECVVKTLFNVQVDDNSCDEVVVLKKLVAGAAKTQPLHFLKDYRVVETESSVEIIMPKHQGKTLLQLLSVRRLAHVLSETEARSVTWGICEALNALHSNDIVHCDLKLENVMVSSDLSDVSVIDFGGAYDITRSSNQLQEKTMVGTPGYIAPERVLRVDDAPTPAADVFSLGILLFQVLVGQHPFVHARGRRLAIDDSLHLDWTHMQLKLEERRVSKEAQHLIQQLVMADPLARISLEQVFQHAWFKN